MRSDTILDHAVFQLSPKHSRCELLVSSNGETERLASGSIQSFVSHLGVLEAQAAQGVQSSIKLEVEKSKHAKTWFTKGTLERFVQFVSNPEALERVNTFDSEMSQLEAAQNLYSQGCEDPRPGASDDRGATAAADATKKELLRAIDLRLDAVKRDLIMAITYASATGFDPDTVSQLQQFADRFDAHRLDEACTKFISLWQRRPNLINLQNLNLKAQTVRSSFISNMSTDKPTDKQAGVNNVSRPHLLYENRSQSSIGKASSDQRQNATDQPELQMQLQPNSTDKTEEDKSDETSNESSTVQTNQPTRRLSVQDRINLFENKQKENSNSGGKPLPVGKSTELRRLSSDVSLAPAHSEKSVLRRWSIVSDMSIDLASDKKSDSSTDSPLCTLSSTPHAGGDLTPMESDEKHKKAENGLDDNIRSIRMGPKSDFQNAGDQRASPRRMKSASGEVEKNMGSGVQVTSEVQSRDSIDLNSPSAAHYLIGSFTDTPENVKIDVKSSKREDDFESKVQNAVRFPRRHSRSLSAHIEGGMEIKSKDLLYKGTEEDLASQPQLRSSTGRARKKELVPSDKQPALMDLQRTKLEKPTSAGSEPRQKSFGGRRSADDGNGRQANTINAVSEGQGNADRVSVDQVQRTRQLKGNQVVNDELKMKANELEKLFAEHSLRGPGDKSSSSRRGKPSETQVEQVDLSRSRGARASETSPMFIDKSSMIYAGDVSGDITKLKTPLTGKMVDDKDNGDALQQDVSELGFSDDSKGKFYEKYMQKRDAKLREEWSSKRSEKETKLKSMQEALERSRDELKAKFSSSSEKKGPLSSARQRAEKFRSFNSRSSMKKYQHPISSFQSEEGEEFSECSDQKYHVKDRSSNGPSTGNSASRSSQVRRLQPNRNTSTVTPRTTTSVPRPSAKVSKSNSGRRRGQSDRPLAQSVPNFSDLKKENTKPSIAVKTTMRMQVRNTARGKNSNEEMPPVMQEKSQRPQSLRKSSSGNIEFTELSTLYSDDMLAPAKFGKEKNWRKIADVDPVTGFVPEVGALDGFENLRNEESDEFESETEYVENMTKEGAVEEELETLEIEDGNDEDDGKLSEEYDKFDNAGIENGSSLRSISQGDPGSVVDLPTTAPTFHTIASLMDSPGESPLSWNSNTHQLFCYPHEHSDIDASVDSPMGSPASWNSRMRKKWGSALNPVMTANSSQLQTRKDVTKGFKRLLKFGRKSRAAESLMDWISVTTSEGDDDAEDRRDISNRSSEDLRKSRMGFSQGHPSDYGFNESEFNEQDSSIPAPAASFKLKEDQISGSSIKAPRSFFSLSTFRSKGNESKPR